MKNASANILFTRQTSAADSPKNASRLLTLAALLLSGLSASASNVKVASEKGFTITPDVSTPIVLRAQPDAACDLHAVGTSDTQSMRFYANGDGYVKIHATAHEGIESRVQLDCSSNGKTVGYPLHLLASTTPTSEMPVPQSNIPMPKGSTVRAGLTEAEAQSMTDEELSRRDYPERPNVLTSPDQYAKWLDQVARPMTILRSHLVSRSDITAAPVNEIRFNWSGLEAYSSTKKTYSAVTADWGVPVIPTASSNGSIDYSAFWVGLDGDGIKDLVQAGTEQDAWESGGVTYSDYYAWSELLPNQPTEQEVFSVNPGDAMTVEVWISTGSGAPNPNGSYGAFRIIDQTQNISTEFYVPLNGTTFNGTEAEWIMERPTVNGGYPELAAYLIANMSGGSALQVNGTKWVDSGTAANRNLSMYNGADELSEAVWLGSGTTMTSFLWLNYK
jgi:hypothetical protein